MKSYFAQAGENMGKINDGVPRFVDLVKDKIAEEFDDISVTSF
jgi:hypothetical protein